MKITRWLALKRLRSWKLLLPFLFAWPVLARSYAGASGVFVETGSIATARYSHTATLLPNGKVLIAGGATCPFCVSRRHLPGITPLSTVGDLPRGTLASVELYDPASGSWSTTCSMAAERSDHTSTLLPNGNVLVAGGSNDPGALASAELYDPTKGTWSATGSLTTMRSGHTATFLPNGKVLVAGGLGTASSSAELYDPVSGTWSATGSLVAARSGHTATLLLDGKVLVAGGIGSNDTLASAELYDPTTGIWTATTNLGTARYRHSATLLPDGKVLVAGGDNINGYLASAELYDPASGTWAATGSFDVARNQHTATLLPDGQVLVAGGAGDGVALASAELYDPVSGIWTATGSLTTARLVHTATLLPNGQVLVPGGYNYTGPVAIAELYLGPPTSPTLVNISARLRVLTGNEVLISGFIITGTDLKRVLVRGIGPSIKGIGVTLSDPTLELHQGSMIVATNDNWKMRPDGTSQQADIEATTIPPANDLESAVLATLGPGAYTAILAGKNGGTGVGLVEIYDLGQGANSRLANISTRGFVDTGDNVMIGGLIVSAGSGGSAGRVLVRALGPSLSVADALGDPTLELRDSGGTLVDSNDNWKTRPDGSSQQAEIEATTIPPANDLESALLQTLPAGNYTAIVRGKNNTTGIGLVEAYNLP